MIGLGKHYFNLRVGRLRFHAGLSGFLNPVAFGGAGIQIRKLHHPSAQTLYAYTCLSPLKPSTADRWLVVSFEWLT